MAEGQYMPAFTGVISMIAFIGLVIYTLHTRRMWRFAQQSRNDLLRPYFVLSGKPQELGAFNTEISIVNLGAHAVDATTWEHNVSDTFVLKPAIFENTSNNIVEFVGPMLKDQHYQFILRHGGAMNHLLIVDCRDTAQRKHQFALHRKMTRDRQHVSYEGRMLLPGEYLPFAQSVILRVRKSWNAKAKRKRR